MGLNRIVVENLLKTNVIEMVWVRRTPKAGASGIRRALATNNYAMLNSRMGVNVLHFHPPVGRKHIDMSKYNLSTYWDLFRQDYRNAPCDTMQIVKTIPLGSPQAIDDWWEYFQTYVANMTTSERALFMEG